MSFQISLWKPTNFNIPIVPHEIKHFNELFLHGSLGSYQAPVIQITTPPHAACSRWLYFFSLANANWISRLRSFVKYLTIHAWEVLSLEFTVSGIVDSQDWVSKNFDSQGPKPKARLSPHRKTSLPLLSHRCTSHHSLLKWFGAKKDSGTLGTHSWIPIYHEKMAPLNWYFS